jgi:ABC-type Fe3+-siderophore transport system permease subunit
MSLDLRIPMGLMFTIVGVILSVYGLVTQGSPIYAKSVGMNINLIWGVVMFVFGAAMFLLGRRAQSRPMEEIEGTTRPLGHGGH